MSSGKSSVVLFSNDDMAQARAKPDGARGKANALAEQKEGRPKSSFRAGRAPSSARTPRGSQKPAQRLEPLQLRFAADVLDDETAIDKAKYLTAVDENRKYAGPTSRKPEAANDAAASQSIIADMNAVGSGIQHSWTLFGRLSDHDRAHFLKGIIAQCGPSQVERICADLNLKLSTSTAVPVHVHSNEIHSLLARTSHSRASVSLSELYAAPEEGSIPNSSFIKKATAKAISLGTPADQSVQPKSPPRDQIRKGTTAAVSPIGHKGSISNVNMYLKLFPDSSIMRSHPLASSEPDTVLKFAEFTAMRCKKLESTMKALNTVSAAPDVHGAALTLMEEISDLLGAQHFAVYTFPNDRKGREIARVECTNWLSASSEVLVERIFGLPYFISNTPPLLNVVHAPASEHFTNACHEQYPEGTRCFLSAAILSEDGRPLAVLELINKRPGHPSHFFDVEDEFIFQSTLATWSLVLKEVKAEHDREMSDVLLRAILSALNLMAREEDLESLLSRMHQTVAEMVSAASVSIHYDLKKVDSDAAFFLSDIQAGRPVLLAHGIRATLQQHLTRCKQAAN